MNSLFKKVRIIHSPLEHKYVVEQKPPFSFRWQHVEYFDYVTVRNTSPHGPHDFPDEALERAKKKAETLLAKSVVWEKTNYDWST
jgi:hypothetical protein